MFGSSLAAWVHESDKEIFHGLQSADGDGWRYQQVRARTSRVPLLIFLEVTMVHTGYYSFMRAGKIGHRGCSHDGSIDPLLLIAQEH